MPTKTKTIYNLERIEIFLKKITHLYHYEKYIKVTHKIAFNLPIVVIMRYNSK